jgi:hypothetical protein
MLVWVAIGIGCLIGPAAVFSWLAGTVVELVTLCVAIPLELISSRLPASVAHTFTSWCLALGIWALGAGVVAVVGALLGGSR